MSTVLAGQQKAFADAVRGHSESQAIDGLLRSTPGGRHARLHIYSNAYRIRLGEALKENYPALARVLGDERFADLAAVFLRDSPSRRPSIRWFGDALPDFVTREGCILPHPSLCDLIRMEWALSVAFDGADAAPLQAADLLAVSPESWPTLRFAPHPTVRMLAMDWNVEPLWTALIADENACTAPPEEFRHDLLVWRRGLQTQWRAVEPAESLLLAACIAGYTIAQLSDIAAEITVGNAVENAAENTGEAAAIVARYLRTWIEGGLFVGWPGDP